MTITGEEGKSASEIETSVGKYGGFYIARYEAGIEGDTENYSLSTKIVTDGSVKPLSQAGKGVWNTLTRKNAIKVAESMINTEDGVKSALISGKCWDTTLQWIVKSSDNSANKPNLNYDIHSSGGWYNFMPNNTPHTTGYFAVNNIYDMAGNVREWSTENSDYNGGIIYRGSDYSDSGGYDWPAALRSSGNTADSYGRNIGFRVVLYK